MKSADWASAKEQVPVPNLLVDEYQKKSRFQYYQANSKTLVATEQLLENSGVIWWMRYFGVMSLTGFLPFGIRWSPEAQQFQVHQNWLRKLVYIIWTAVALGYTFEFFEILITSQKPRVQDVQEFLALGGANLFLGISVVITWRKDGIVKVMNTFAEIWLERHPAVSQKPQGNPRAMASRIFRRSQRWYITAAVVVGFLLLQCSIWVQMANECGYQVTCVTGMMCSYRRMLDACSGPPSILGVYFSLARSISTMVEFSVDLFLVTSVGFYGWILEDFTQFGDDESVELVLKHHHKVAKLLDMFNETVGLPMILILGGALPYYIGTLPDLAIRFIGNEFDFEYTRAVVCYWYFFGTYFWGASKYCTAKDRIRRWADRPETMEKAGSNLEFQMAILSLKTDSRLDFSPCGWFTVDPDFCKGVISFSATYAIILVQLQQSKPVTPVVV